MRVHTRGGIRAMNKPLLLLFALGRVQRKQPRLATYAEIEPELKQLLTTFGSRRSGPHPEQAFWHLQTDGLWDLDHSADNLSRSRPGSSVYASELRALGVRGGFPVEDQKFLARNPMGRREVAHYLLSEYFPSDRHAELLVAVN